MLTRALTVNELKIHGEVRIRGYFTFDWAHRTESCVPGVKRMKKPTERSELGTAHEAGVLTILNLRCVRPVKSNV